MQPVVLYAIVAACMVLAIVYYSRRGLERLGWLVGIALAGLAALFSPSIILITDSLSQTIALFLALALAIVMVSLLINKLLAARLPVIRARIKQRKDEKEREERLEAAERYWQRKETEKKENKEPGIIDIQEERKRRKVKQTAFSEEYFYEQSEPLEAEAGGESLPDADDMLLTAEADSKIAVEIAFGIDHRQKVTEAQIISRHLEGTDLEVEHEVITEHDNKEPIAADDPVDKLDDQAIELLDQAWKHRDAGRWQQSLEAYRLFCEMVDDRRLCMEVQIEQLATMISAGMAEAATDKVFDILTYGEELTDNERKQVTKALEYLQNI